jgi:hypothetical protein
MKGYQSDIGHLRSLGSGHPGLLDEAGAVVASNAVLWKLGGSIEREVGAAWKPLRDDAGMMWDGAASMADHQLTGQQLHHLYQTMQQQGHQDAASSLPSQHESLAMGE